MSNNLEKESTPSEEIPKNSACIIDAMSIVHKIKGNHKTFKEVAENYFVKQSPKEGLITGWILYLMFTNRNQ